MTKRRWTPADDEELRRYAREHSFRKQADWYAYVAEKTHRTAGSVQQRCFLIKLRPTKLRCCPTCRRVL